jgi:plastocyanin
VHEVAIYDDGTTPEQVVRAGAVTKAGSPPAPYITGVGDPTLVRVVGQPMCAGGSRTVSHTFSAPGRYLVICSFIPHLNLNMYGWVEVRARQQ